MKLTILFLILIFSAHAMSEPIPRPRPRISRSSESKTRKENDEFNLTEHQILKINNHAINVQLSVKLVTH